MGCATRRIVEIDLDLLGETSLSQCFEQHLALDFGPQDRFTILAYTLREEAPR